jgi:hypothetical protein
MNDNNWRVYALNWSSNSKEAPIENKKPASTEDKKKNPQSNRASKNEELKAAIEKQIEAMQWIQAVAVFTEAILVSKLYTLKEDFDGERNIVIGIWIQTIGQLIESTGVSKQIRTNDEIEIIRGQKMLVTGDFLQAIGAALQAIGGEELLLADRIGNLFDFVVP